jgi:excisionase family DNA binding protein
LPRALSTTDPDEVRAYTVAEAAEVLSLSAVHLRRIIKRGEIRVKRVGRRILVPTSAIKEFLDSDSTDSSSGDGSAEVAAILNLTPERVAEIEQFWAVLGFECPLESPEAMEYLARKIREGRRRATGDR